MAHSKYEARYFAEQIVYQLLRDEKVRLDFGNDIVIYDLERDTMDFLNDLELLEDLGMDMPAIRVSGEYLVPISLSFFAGLEGLWPSPEKLVERRKWRRYRTYYEILREVLYELKYSQNSVDLSDGIEPISRSEAHATFLSRATDFLETRIAAVKAFDRQDRGLMWSLLSLPQKVGGPKVTTPGCHFTVTSNSPGLRVFWTGAYRISKNYFSSPTSPTASILQSGTYMFGVDGGAYGNAIQWDTNAVVSLPGNPQIHLNY